MYSKQEIFEYMMYDPVTTVAPTGAGRRTFETECARCHRFGDMGEDYGPDLTTLANRLLPERHD